MSERVNILYLINSLRVGGAETALARTVTRLDKDKYNPTVCCLQTRGPVADEIEEAGIKVICLNARGKLDITVLYKLFRILKKERNAILHSYLYQANILGRVIGKLAGVPIVVCSEQSVLQSDKIIDQKPPEMTNRLRAWLNKLTAPLADRVIAACNAVKEVTVKHVGINPEKVVIIYNGVDLDKYNVAVDPWETRRRLGIDISQPVVGTVGGLRPIKGHDYLLRAASRVLHQGIGPVAFLIVGGGSNSERARLQALADHSGISSSVIFAGYRVDVEAVLSVMDIFVLPSLYEGLPNALLEAMAACRPVVATQVGGIPEVVVEGETGFLVPPRDPGALARAICVLLEDRERAREMGIAGRKRVERLFSVETMVARTEVLYEELIGEKMGLKWVEGEGWQPAENRS